MQINKKILVTSIRKFKGDVDGVNYDFTKLVYLDSDTDTNDNDKEKGNYSQEVTVGDSYMFDELSKHSYPCIFDATMKIINTRKGLTSEIIALKHVSSLKDILK